MVSYTDVSQIGVVKGCSAVHKMQQSLRVIATPGAVCLRHDVAQIASGKASLVYLSGKSRQLLLNLSFWTLHNLFLDKITVSLFSTAFINGKTNIVEH